MELREFNEYCIKVKELIRERVWLQRVAESIRETFGEGFKPFPEENGMPTE